MKLIVFGLCGLALMPRISSAHGIHFDSQELDEVSVTESIEAIHTLGGIGNCQGICRPV